MLINGMDFLNSFRGCQVVDFRMTKRFKGQLEGKNGYIYGVLAVEGILCLVIIVFLKWIVVGPVTLKTIMIDREFIVIMVCISILVALYVYRQKKMLLVVEYTLRIDDTCFEEDNSKKKRKKKQRREKQPRKKVQGNLPAAEEIAAAAETTMAAEITMAAEETMKLNLQPLILH